MFNLEQSIADWRRQMLAGGIKTPVPLEELESHLRDDIDRRMSSGAGAAQAFEMAVQEIGQPDTLQNEFARAGATIQARIKHFIPVLGRLLNPQLVFNMNTSNITLNMEPRQATYLKATAFLLPAVFAWGFAVVFLLPKLQQICHTAGMAVFSFREAPAIFRIFGAVGDMLVWLTAHGLLIVGGVVLAIVLLEWRSNGWPRYRRTTVGAGIFVFNFAVLISITLMVISSIVATTALMHHIK